MSKHTRLTLKYLLVAVAGLILLPLIVLAQSDPAAPRPAAELADPDGQFIEIDGISIYYIERGDPADPAVLLLHGFGGSTFTWRDNLDALAAAGFHVIAFDRPPYGLAAKSAELDYTPAYYVELTAGLMDAWDLNTAALVGHSAGGGVIAQFAATYPERVTALVLVAGAVALEADTNTAELTPTEEAQPDASPLGSLFGAVSALDPDSPFARTLVRTLLTPERFTDLLTSAYYDPTIVTDEVSAGYQRVLQVEGWEGAFLKLFTAPPQQSPLAVEELEALTIPTLLMWGAEDTWVPLTAGERLMELIPNAELITYPLVGHLPMEEAVEAFNTDLIAWLTATIDR